LLVKFLIGSAIASALLTIWEISETAKDFDTEGVPYLQIFQLFVGLTIIQWTFISLIAGLGWLLNSRK
jgi:hypothetical protein